MGIYALRRLLISLPTLIGVSLLIFFVLRILPGDPTSVMFSGESFTVLSEADQQRFRSDLGLDQPYHLQYLSWMGDIARGDLGNSFFRKSSVAEMVGVRAPITIQIAVMAITFSWVIGVPLGFVCATSRNRWQDNLTRGLAAVLLAIPEFWLAVVAVVIGVIHFSWRPPVELVYLWQDPWRNLQMTIGPALALGLVAAAYLVRITRSSVLEVLHADYVRTARAKGVQNQIVLLRHVLRNALFPIITLSSLAFAGMLGGSVAVEQAFSVPGLGTALVKGLTERDYMVVQNLVLMYAAVFIVMNLLVDLAYGWLDPRVRYN